MRVDDRALGASVEAFRRATARDADGEATRARVLVAARGRARRRLAWRRMAVGVAIGTFAALTGSAAWTALGRWRASPASVTQATRSITAARVAVAPQIAVATSSPISIVPVATRAVPFEKVRRDDGEARAYGQAHAAHFVTDAPAEALDLWDAYLRRYPRGTFAPEARFNRALCLLRLGRRDDARVELRPFAAGELGGYRQREAATLIDWTEPTADPSEPR
jgi:TolA-binding protein